MTTDGLGHWRAPTGARWWLTNLALFLVVVSTWSVALNWWPGVGEGADVLSSRFLIGIFDDMLVFLFFSGVFLAVYLVLIYARKIRSRRWAIIWSPIIGLGLWGGLTNLGPSTLVLGLAYASVVRLRVDSPEASEGPR